MERGDEERIDTYVVANSSRRRRRRGEEEGSDAIGRG